MKEEELYSVNGFIYWLEKYADTSERKYSAGQIAQIIGKAMLDFFEESGTSY